MEGCTCGCHNAARISCQAMGSPPALGVGKLRQVQGQWSRLAGSAPGRQGRARSPSH